MVSAATEAFPLESMSIQPAVEHLRYLASFPRKVMPGLETKYGSFLDAIRDIHIQNMQADQHGEIGTCPAEPGTVAVLRRAEAMSLTRPGRVVLGGMVCGLAGRARNPSRSSHRTGSCPSSRMGIRVRMRHAGRCR